MSYENDRSGRQQIAGYIRELDGFLHDRGLLPRDESVASSHNDSLDAFRHAYVMGRLTMDYNAFLALKAGRDHERDVPNDPSERRMDLHNNAMGVSFGRQVSEGVTSQGSISRDPYLSKLSKPEQLFVLIEGGVERGELILYPQQGKPRTGQLRAGLDDQSPEIARNGLADSGHPLNRQFEQALKGANGDKDAAALAVQTISQAPGFKPDQDIGLVQGKNGLIVSQGDGATGINVLVPQAKQGDFERVSTQLAQTPPSAINPPDLQQQNETQRQSNLARV